MLTNSPGVVAFAALADGVTFDATAAPAARAAELVRKLRRVNLRDGFGMGKKERRKAATERRKAEGGNGNGKAKTGREESKD